ncbi:MAG: hypothetical protein AAFV19_15090 [Pseudomonadota bacterium]
MGWRAKRLVLHIGAPRTGTSALQIWMRRNRAVLGARGVLYPEISGNAFVAAMAPVWPVDVAQRLQGLTGWRQVRALRRDVAAALRREVDAVQPETIFVSAEQFFDRLDRPAVRRRLHRLLSPLADRVDILLYLRRQDQAIFSRHWNSVRLGRRGAFVAPGRLLPEYDYERRVRPWARLFGEHAIIVCPFERVRLPGGSIVADVLARLGVDPALAADAGEKNASLDLVRAEFLQRITAHLGRTDQMGNFRDDLNWSIDQVTGDWPSATLPARDARVILGLYEAANARLAARWGEGGAFFDMTVSEDIRGGAEGDAALDIDDVIEIAAQLWIRKTEQVRKLRSRVRTRKDRRS